MKRKECFEYFPAKIADPANITNERWFVRWRASNGEVRMVSEAYFNKGAAKRAATGLSNRVPGSVTEETKE